jgi:predicted DNA-binding transcriptional regulator YafY
VDPIPRLSRLTSILTQLQSKKLVTAPELANKYGVSVRTIYRDIRSLEASGIPICTEEGRGYSIIEGYTLPPVSFTEKEANALITGFSLISRNKDSSLVESYENAIIKVKSVLRNNEKDKAQLLSERVVFVKNLSSTTTSNILSSVQLAITALTVVEIKYRSLYKNEESLRMIEPQALYHTQDNWILIAWCQLRNDFREFRLDRVLTIKLLSEQFEDRQFNLMKYFQEQIKKANLNP